jgi:hypothetical protein
MSNYEKALEALDKPENEPINWLLGPILKEQAKHPRSHFLLDALEGPRTPLLIRWNYWIEQYRAALTNPKEAPRKACIDITAGTDDSEDKLRSFIAEIFAVLHLRHRGYTNFEVIVPEEGKARTTPDYHADFEDTKTRIEVKNLREPEDLIRTVAKERWQERRDANPERYNFRAILRYSHRGRLSNLAISRLCNILDEFPNVKSGRVEEVLDGGVKILLERLNDGAIPAGGLEGILLTQIFDGSGERGELVIQSSIRTKDFDFHLSDFQDFFVKVLRVVAAATPKFFGSAASQQVKNVIFLNWEPPDLFVNAEFPERTQEKINQLFADFSLELELIISFRPPELPLSVLKSR